MNNIGQSLEEFSNKKILVIGDVMLDHYSYGKATKISPEAPVLILHKNNEFYVPGGAGNVAQNLAALGAKSVLCGVIGRDGRRNILLKTLGREKNIDTVGLLTVTSRSTVTKHRFVADNHQLLRVDEEETTCLDNEVQKKLLSLVEKEIKKCDGVILSDYAKGVFSENFTRQVIRIAKSHRKIVVADIKPSSKDFFIGVDVLTPNWKEAKEMSGESELSRVGDSLVKFFNANIVVTRGEEGVSVFTKEGTSKDFPTKKIKVFDVSGAGDTSVAVLALGLTSGLDINDSAYLANYAGGLVVQKPGTATISLEELRSAVNYGNHIDEVAIVPKVWGYEKWIENNDKYCSKIFFLKKGYQCSLHYHKIKDETFIVLKGNIRMEVGDEVLYMKEGNFCRITPGVLHRFRGLEDSEFLEVSSHHSEDDSYRLEESRRVEAE
ncbi:cupin domain-containing protein [Candidatus Parcubacteria bacterium]|nr:MAG: cupin domain-containing protein [Candidatus Parcubacteria bacterium]